MADNVQCAGCQAQMAADDAFCQNCGARSPIGGGAPRAQGSADVERKRAVSRMLDIVRPMLEGKFELLKALGQGGMGSVFLARDVNLEKLRAIKVLGIQLADVPEHRERFFREARTQAALEHPNIVPVYQVEKNSDLPYIVMQFVPGRALSSIMAQEWKEGRQLRIDVVLALAQQIGSGLAHAHAHGVVHRDIKPSNVLLTATGNATVTDFGIAKVLAGTSLSVTGGFMGTPPYMSPEQCRGVSSISAAADQYSFGAMVFELLAGRTPFTGSNMAIVEAHMNHPPPSLGEFRPDAPPAVVAAIARMLEKDSANRFPSMAQALKAIDACDVDPSLDDPLRRELMRLSGVEQDHATVVTVAAAAAGRGAPAPPASNRAEPAPPPPPSRPTPVEAQIASPTPAAPIASVPARTGGRRAVWVVAPIVLIGAAAWAIYATSDPAGSPEISGDTGTASAADNNAPLRLVIAPELARDLAIGDTLRLVANVARGATMLAQAVTWQSENERVVSVTRDGLARAVAPGRATIVATSDGAPTERLTIGVTTTRTTARDSNRSRLAATGDSGRAGVPADAGGGPTIEQFRTAADACREAFTRRDEAAMDRLTRDLTEQQTLNAQQLFIAISEHGATVEPMGPPVRDPSAPANATVRWRLRWKDQAGASRDDAIVVRIGLDGTSRDSARCVIDRLPALR
jgi:eukaryotic-like serine/threonine-protein kinase